MDRPAAIKRITIADVALRAGVSIGSVSKVLSGRKWVSKDLKETVEKAAKELSYVPNTMAQSLKSRRTMTIAALVSDISNPLHGLFLQGVQKELEKAGYFLLVASTNAEPERDCALLELFDRGRVDGVIVTVANEQHLKTRELLQKLSVPVVFHDRDLLEYGDVIGANHRAGAIKATQYLLELGHRRIALFSPPPFTRPGRDRLAGYREALENAGIAYDPALVRAVHASSSEAAHSDARMLLFQPQRPSALICLSTQMMAGIIGAINNMGLRMPEEISVVGIGDTDLVKYNAPAISTVRWDMTHCGRSAAQLMLQRLNGESTSHKFQKIEISTDFVLRGSCAAPALLET